MPSVTPQAMAAFVQELEKQAFVPTAQLTRGGLALGAGLTGGTIGGMYQGSSEYNKARQQGATRTQALRAGLKGGVTGGAIGGAAGAGLGAIAPGMGGKLRDFGGQMLHMWTGAGGKKGMETFGGGAAQTRQRVADAAKQLEKAHAGQLEDPRFFGRHYDKMMGRAPIGKDKILAMAQKEHESAQLGHKAMERAQELGLTSLPGAAKAIVTNPIEAAKGAYGAMAHGTSGAQKALALGLPGAFAAYGAIRKPQEGETRLGNIAGSVMGAVPAALPMMPSSIALSMIPGIPNPGMAASRALEHGGKAMGNAVQRAVVGGKPGPGQVAPPPSGGEA